MKIIRNLKIEAKEQDILADLFLKKSHRKELLIFCHGFKGFKDWGAWDLVAKEFAEAGYVFLKFNFSENGIGQENLSEFTRLDLFEQNNYSKEIRDLKLLLKEIRNSAFWQEEKLEKIHLIGHSRGGGIAAVVASEEQEIASLITWASIASFDRFGSEENIAQWKQEGSKNFYNSRTQQDMKIAFQFYEDYAKNKERLNIEACVKNLEKPMLIIHGTADEAVGFSHAQRLKNWKPDAELFLIENANHVFGAS
ncbi:MAG: alpha/beta hydrolase, partial [Bacteroidetes bacterium]|nr:alpha/beta hydrolase [Bacteroidota bacterium]